MHAIVRRRVAVGLIVGTLIVAGVVIGRGMVSGGRLQVTELSSAHLDTAAGARVFFGHQSVGANVISGIGALAATGHGWSVVESSVAPSGDDGALIHAYVGLNGDPQSKLDAFAEVIDGGMGASVDAALLKFCYVDVTAATDVPALLDAYTQTLAQLQARHPDVTFLYATVPLTAARDLKATVKSWLGRDEGMGPEDNIARQQFNSALRDRFGGTGLLFDIAAVEAGIDQGVAPSAQGGNGYYVLHDSFAADPGHLNDAGARAAASEFVRVVASAVGRR
ncbi:hypothetical protein [Microbacterium aurum]